MSTRGVLTVVLLAMVPAAALPVCAQTTVFLDDFDDITAGAAASSTTLNTGRDAAHLIGSWTVDDQRQAQVDTNTWFGGVVPAAHTNVLALERGYCDFTAHFDSAASLSNGVTISFDISGTEPQHFPCGRVSVFDTNANELVRVSLTQQLGTAEPNIYEYHDIAYWNGSEHVLLLDNWRSKPAPVKFASVELALGTEDWSIRINGGPAVEGISYLATERSGSVNRMRFLIAPTGGVNTTRGTFAVDNIRANTAEPQPQRDGTVIVLR